MDAQTAAVTYSFDCTPAGSQFVTFFCGGTPIGVLYIPRDPRAHWHPFRVRSVFGLRWAVRYLRWVYPAWRAVGVRETLAVLLVARNECLDRGILEG